MKREIETGFVALLEAALELEENGYRSAEENIEAARNCFESLGALYELAAVPYDCNSPGPEVSASPLLTWLWAKKAAEEVSSG